jgi:sugar lactone lactonase YvrE
MLAGLLAGSAATGSAQSQELSLGPPDAVLAEPFSLVRGALETSDAKLLLTDWIEQRIVLADFSTGAVRDAGRTGAGPAEFRLPGALLPWPGDSVLLIDAGNARLAVLGPDGAIRRTFQPTAPGALNPSAVDTAGRLYYTIPPWLTATPLAGDSVQVARWDPRSDEVALLATIHGSKQASGDNRSPYPRVPFVVFAPQDAFAISPSGRMTIATGADYHLRILENGRETTGPSYASETVRATDAERRAYVRAFLQGSAMSGRGQDGVGHVPAHVLTDEGVAGVMRASSFAATLPFFRPGGMRTDDAGRTWVEHWSAAGQALRHDVFDARGVRIATLRLPSGRRLLALGRSALYLVATDANGLQTVERYPFPAVLRPTGAR